MRESKVSTAYWMSYSEYRERHPERPIKKTTYQQYINRARRLFKKSWDKLRSDFDREGSVPDLNTLEEWLMEGKNRGRLQYLDDFLVSTGRHLAESAPEYSSDHWRLLRNCLVVFAQACDLDGVANQLSNIKNPIESKKRRRKVGREARLKKVTHDDFMAVYRYFSDSRASGVKQRLRYKKIRAQLILGYRLGLRPAEALGVTILKTSDTHCIVKIAAVKTTELGTDNRQMQRGIDRVIKMANQEFSSEIMSISEAVEMSTSLTKADIDAARTQIARASKKLWPRRKRRFSLYSLRYNFGSHAKSHLLKSPAGSKRRAIEFAQISALLGHKNSASSSCYGYKVSAGGGLVKNITVDPTTVRKVKIAKQHLPKKSIGADRFIEDGPAP